jgi:DnaJ-class molecular chaperone
MNNLIECPKCLGTGDVVIPEENNKKLHDVPCQLCKGTGVVHNEIANDFIFSLNEDFDLD